MRRTLRSFRLALLALITVGCMAEAPDSSDGAGAAGKADESAASCERPTLQRIAEKDSARRIASLNRYGDALLSYYERCELPRTFQERGVAAPAPLARTVPREGETPKGYRIEVGYDGCFDSWFDATFYGSTYYDRVASDVEHAAAFLAKFHERNQGQPARTFDKLTICPMDTEVATADGLQSIGRLYLDPTEKNLRLGVDVYGFQWPDSREEILTEWLQGTHIQHLFPRASFWRVLTNAERSAKIQILWRLIDPIGDARALLRSTIQGAATRLRDRLAALKTQSNADALLAKLRGELESTTLDRSIGGRNPRRCADTFLASADLSQRKDFAALWAQSVDRADRWHGAAESVVAATQQPPRDTRVRKIQECTLFSFENVKIVDVNVSLYFADSLEEFEAYQTYEERPVTDIEVRQTGLICFSLEDEVRVNLSVTRAVETKGLEDALDAMGVACSD